MFSKKVEVGKASLPKKESSVKRALFFARSAESGSFSRRIIASTPAKSTRGEV